MHILYVELLGNLYKGFTLFLLCMLCVVSRMDFLPMTLSNEDDVTSMQNHASKQDDGLKSRLKDGKDDRYKEARKE